MSGGVSTASNDGPGLFVAVNVLKNRWHGDRVHSMGGLVLINNFLKMRSHRRERNPSAMSLRTTVCNLYTGVNDTKEIKHYGRQH
jgi:hypothetical protein